MESEALRGRQTDERYGDGYRGEREKFSSSQQTNNTVL